MISLNDIHPPRWPVRFLRFFVKKEYLEEIEGDMEEVFQENLEAHSLQKARALYCMEVLKLLRLSLMKNVKFIQQLNQCGMFKNYFKVSIRGLLKNPMNSFINIVGLSVAIGFCIFVYAFARWTYSTDQFHENKQTVFLTTFFANRDGSEQQFGNTPRPLAEMLRTDFPQLESVCRVEDRSVIIKQEDNVFHERIRYTDPEFLDMFTFPLKWGTAKSLNDVNSIIINEDMSIKYFGEENPIGQILLVKFDKERSKEFKVTGVAKEFPKALTIKFDFLINFENFRTSEPGYDFHDWNALVNATLIKVKQPEDIKSIAAGMDKYRVIQNKVVKEDWAISSFGFEPLITLHEQSEYIRDDISRSSKSNYSSVVYLIFVGTFMLALACFNFINIAIASATKRLKEIGVRKSIGANRGAVIVQFLSENMVITFFALLLGLVVGYTFFIPGFEYLWHFSMDFSFADKSLWIYLPIILSVTALASGAYPAFYISKFQAVGILKGSVKFGQKNPITKLFLGLQLILACVFITGAVMFTQNSRYMTQRSWGYNQDEALYAMVPDQAAYEQLQALMMQDPDVISVAGSVHHLGKNNTSTVLHFPDRDYEADQLQVSATYFETMGIPLKQGRLFTDHEGSDQHAVVVNELLVKNMGWTQAIGQTFTMDSLTYEVVGVVKDFHSYSFFKYIQPTIFTVANKEAYRFLSLRARPHSESKVYSVLQTKWATLYPEVPFEGGHQEDVWGNYFIEMGIHGLVWRVIAIIAIALAGLGLYGLVSLNVSGRIKEFSIRKVLGAEMKNIARNIYGQYALLFALALTAGAPISYMLVKLIFDSSYEYHMPVNFSGTAISVVILILVLVLTVSLQIRKVLKSNPVNGLKAE
jgi:putative ABC transport system permease protein